MSTSNLDSRSLLDELRSFDRKKPFFDFGHPLLNRIADSFITAAGVFQFSFIHFAFLPLIQFSIRLITQNLTKFFTFVPLFQIGAVQAVSREAYFTAIEGALVLLLRVFKC